MTMRCSLSPLWRNTVGLCEVQSRIDVVNRRKYYPDYFPDPLALRVNSSREGLRVLASFKHTPHQKHGMSQSVTNAGESQWAFDYSAVKPVVWSGNIWIRNERVSQRGLYWSLDSCSGWRWRSPNKGLDLGLFLAVVWILKIWITAHE